jgi:hypothetical protein
MPQLRFGRRTALAAMAASASRAYNLSACLRGQGWLVYDAVVGNDHRPRSIEVPLVTQNDRNSR